MEWLLLDRQTDVQTDVLADTQAELTHRDREALQTNLRTGYFCLDIVLELNVKKATLNILVVVDIFPYSIFET